MTREQALNYLKSSGMSKEQIQAIVKALSGSEIPTDSDNLSSELEKNSKKLEKDFGESDCISRSDIIDKCKYVIEHGKPSNGKHSISVETLLAVVQTMPSVLPKADNSVLEDIKAKISDMYPNYIDEKGYRMVRKSDVLNIIDYCMGK